MRRPTGLPTTAPSLHVVARRAGRREAQRRSNLTFDEDADDAVHPRVKVRPGSGNRGSVDDLRIDAGHGRLDPQHLADLPDLGLHRLRGLGRRPPPGKAAAQVRWSTQPPPVEAPARQAGTNIA